MDGNGEGLTVLGLHIESVKRVKVVDLAPPAIGTVKVRGKNRAGKSSILDSIGMAISTDEVPDQPIRVGEKEGNITLRLGAGLDEKYIVKKTFTAKGTYLAVSAKHDGQTMKMASPQRFLDDLRGAGIGFDPREFCAAKPATQVEMFLSVLRLPEDPRKLDVERETLYARRREINRQVDQAKAVMDAENAKPLPEAPEEEVSISSLVAELEQRQAKVTANAALRQGVAHKLEKVKALKGAHADEVAKDERKIDDIRHQIAELEAQLDALVTGLEVKRAHYADAIREAEQAARAAEQACANLTDPNVAEVKAQIATAEQTNRAVRTRQTILSQRKSLTKRYEDVAAQSKALTSQIEAIDKRKSDLYAQAVCPINGLAISQDPKGGYYLTYRGVPISQCSASEQMEIGMSIAAALNPRLKVILIREASLMDEETQAKVNEWALAHGYQVWQELVGEGGDGFVIEDGEIAPAKQ